MNNYIYNLFFVYGFDFLVSISNCILFFVQCRFLICFNEVNSKKIYYIYYIFFEFFSVFVITYFNFLQLLPIIIILGSIYLFTRYIIRQPVAISILSSLLVYVIEQFSIGIIAPVVYFIFNQAISMLLYQIIMLITSLLTVIITAMIYWYIIKKIKLKSVELNRYFFILLTPILLLLVFLYLTGSTGSWDVTTLVDENYNVKVLFQFSFIQELQAFCISLAAIASIFAILFFYQKVMEFFKTEQIQIILEQQIYAQKNYIEEAKSRVNQTITFRHDFNNHLAVVNGLLEKNNIQEAIKYLNKIGEVTSNLSFLCNTGNYTIDALLCNKLSIAKQLNIDIECNVSIPTNNNLDDFDLCTIFSNAIDNAITACKLVDNTNKFISLTTSLDGNFFMIEVKNSFNPLIKAKSGSGIGINNMQEVVKKYNGALSTDIISDCFRINILLILLEHLNGISEQFS